MQSPILATEIGARLLEALGLPPNTSGFTLRCYSGEFVTVTCEYAPEDGDALVAALSEFEVMRRDPLELAPGEHYDTWRKRKIEADHAEFMRRTSRLPGLTR